VASDAFGRQSVAVVGLACRFPGASHPKELWSLLRRGLEATGSLQSSGPGSASRRDPTDGVFSARAHEKVIDGVADFDADFFNISPREARSMDPRQRLALELTWELLESAFSDPATVRGDRVAVFMGEMNDDYEILMLRNGSKGLDHYAFSGVSRGLIANRISYKFGLHGPSLTVDCGQSSSLVAVHLGCESIRTGDSSLAIVGGVHLNLADEITALESKFGGVSRSGHTYTFDERADGYVRGEGGGMVLLKPLEAAIADGNRIHAVIRGSSVCNAGDTAGALTVPSVAGQVEVLRQAYASAGLDNTDVDYVELHGTGTKVGDPVEAQALGEFFAGRTSPVSVGSVKTNIGHLEGAAGIAGLLKAILAVENAEIPASLNFASPNPRVDLEGLGIRVNSELKSWSVEPGRARRAGVSSFGMGGTNAHVIVEQAPAEERKSVGEQPLTRRDGVVTAGGSVLPWLLSARSAAALVAQARRLLAAVEEDDGLDPIDVGFSLASRSLFEHRAVVAGGDRRELIAGLAELGQGEPGAGVVTGRAGVVGKTVLVFPGQGSQWIGMGRELLQESPVFAEQMRRCGEALARYVDWSLLDVVEGVVGAPSLDRVDVVQPVLWAVMVSLAAMWRAVGVEPDAVIGHSQGEIAAAYVAGVLSLNDSAAIIALRSRLLVGLAGSGGMVSLACGLARARKLLDGFGERLSIAAINGLSSVVVSGDLDPLQELMVRSEASGVRARRIGVDYASHSAQVDVIREPLLGALKDTVAQSSAVKFFSTVTGGLFDTAGMDAGYWYSGIRESVQFEQALRSAWAQGCRVFVEASPHPVLFTSIEDTLAHGEAARAEDFVVVPTLGRDHGGLQQFWMSLGQAHVAGVRVNWSSAFSGSGGRPVALPTYAFMRRRFWLSPAVNRADVPDNQLYPTARQLPEHVSSSHDVRPSGPTTIDHPVLDRMVTAENGLVIFSGHLSPDANSSLVDCVLDGVAVMFPAVIAEMLLSVGHMVGAPRIDNVNVVVPLMVRCGETARIRVVVALPDSERRRHVEVYSESARLSARESARESARVSGMVSDDAWVKHAEGSLHQPGVTFDVLGQPVMWPPENAVEIQCPGLDGAVGTECDLSSGHGGLQRVWTCDGDLYAQAAIPAALVQAGRGFMLHPALFDAALRPWSMYLADGGCLPAVPRSWCGVTIRYAVVDSVLARLSPLAHDSVAIQIVDIDGNEIVAIDSLQWEHVSEPVSQTSEGRRANHGSGIAKVVPAASGAAVHDLIITEICELLEYSDPQSVADKAMFSQLGLDSLAAVKLRDRVARRTGIRLPATAIYDYPSVQDLASYISSKMIFDNIARPVLRQLDDLQQKLQVVMDETIRGPIIDRLQELIAKYGHQTSKAQISTDLSTASDEELFGLVDEHLN
jgi:polyketide synthase 7